MQMRNKIIRNGIYMYRREKQKKHREVVGQLLTCITGYMIVI